MFMGGHLLCIVLFFTEVLKTDNRKLHVYAYLKLFFWLVIERLDESQCFDSKALICSYFINGINFLAQFEEEKIHQG